MPTATTERVQIPRKLIPVYGPPRGAAAYRATFGGRGSGKSQTAALMAAIWGLADPLRILCAREFQVSIAESFHAELKSVISERPWLACHYDLGRDYLRGANGTEFLFRGLRRNEQSIKSLAGIDLTIVEEAEDVPETSWLALEATVFRQPKSELWSIWNPRTKGSPVDQRFRINPPANALVAEINWHENPFFPEGLQRLRKREHERLDPQTYAHVWEGAYLENSASQVFANKVRTAEFTPGHNWNGPYQGSDFGFAQDPTTCVRVWIYNDSLWVEYEAGKVQLDIDATAEYLARKIPDVEAYTTRADSARPETISYLKRHGLPKVEGVKKWQGSVEDGVQFMRSFREIVVHPRCNGAINEFRLYSYKVDRMSGDVLPVIVDAHNHYIDAIRYALAPMIQAKSGPRIRTL